MKRHSLDDESTHPGSLIAGSRLPPKRGLTWPGSTLVPSYSVESDYAPGPWSAAAAAADEAAAELDPVRAAPEAWVAFTRERGDDLPEGVVRRVGSICEYLDEKSGRVYYHDSETSSTAWARPVAFADEEDRAHAVAPRSPNRLGGLRNALRRRADVFRSWSASRGRRSSSCRPRSGTSLR